MSYLLEVWEGKLHVFFSPLGKKRLTELRQNQGEGPCAYAVSISLFFSHMQKVKKIMRVEQIFNTVPRSWRALRKCSETQP